jgi:putative spermidine/putrescine transport system permease protein
MRRLGLPVWLLGVPAIMVLLLFFGMPLYENALRSIGISSLPGSHSALTLGYYTKLFTDAYYRGVIFETLKVSLWSTLLCLLVGYPVAYFVVRRAGKWTGLVMFVLLLPLLTSIIMRTFGWNVLLGRHGLVNDLMLWAGLIARPLRLTQGDAIVYLGTVHVMVPYMVLSIIPVLKGVDRRLEESARILGAGAIRTFVLVTFPLSIEGVITGCLIVFMVTNGSFLTMLLLGNGAIVTLPLLIFQQFSQAQDMGFAAAMGNLLLLMVMLCVYLQGRLTSRRTREGV